ncbi:restriction endonuclease [Pseudonocardia sp.]|uniref:restriction endonuclease n=1 Tax=Pseudonocardia sp. TaxID=60912 RepID=UPI003D13D753
MDTTARPDPVILVLAEADSDGAVSHKRGHLFEQFIGRLFEQFGYEEPTTDRLQVYSHGIELDLRLRHKLSGSTAIIECKAYSSPVNAAAVTSFYGKLSAEKLDHPATQGFFVALPRLTAEARSFADKVQATDKNLRVLVANDVAEAISSRDLVVDLPSSDARLADPALVITEHGAFAAAIELDEATRLGTAVRVAGEHGLAAPHPVIKLLEQSEYARGLPVLSHQTDAPSAAPALREGPLHETEPVIATVTGSSSDFEYQLPAAPKYFVGRRDAIRDLDSILENRGRVIVLNAQSGWGKSSLALRFKQLVEDTSGHAMVLDARTASSKAYVSSVLRRLAIDSSRKGLLTLPEDSSWATLPGALRSLANSTIKPGATLLLLFDQFENVFRDESLTREFRDLALSVAEIPTNLIIGFSWKTDYVGWTEGHPYQLRDEIRAVAQVVRLEPFGPRDVETLLRRLEKAAGTRLSRELRQRLREYSQGLPWLFKKLAGHVIAEVRAGTSQEQLLSEALNVQSLFEADLSELNPHQQEALRHVARFAPINLVDVMDRVEPAVLQSLLDRRLIVQVGERLDTYWDIFRDFLVSGRVPIEDSYILRMAPISVARLLTEIERDGGDSYLPDVAQRLSTSENTLRNLVRELRLLGASSSEPNRANLLPEIWTAGDREAALRNRVGRSLRRHRAYSSFLSVCERGGGSASFVSLGRALRGVFPAVAVADTTWVAYARVYAHWFEYANLATVYGQTAEIAPEGYASSTNLLSAQTSVRRTGVFPQIPAGPALAMLLRVRDSAVTSINDLPTRDRRVCRELATLRAVSLKRDGSVALLAPDVLQGDSWNRSVLRDLLSEVGGLRAALDALDSDGSLGLLEVGRIVGEVLKAQWSDATAYGIGKNVRSWAKTIGVQVRRPNAVRT